MRINRTVRAVSVLSIRIADPIMAAANTIEMMMLVYIALFEVILLLPVITGGISCLFCSYGSNYR